MDLIIAIMAVLSFGLSCFKIGYEIGKDVARRKDSRPHSPKQSG